MDVVVLIFAAALSVLAGLSIAAFSIIQIARLRGSGALSGLSRTSTGGTMTRSVRKAMVVLQVALAFVLLTGAGLLLTSFRQLLRVQPGYDTEGILTASTLAPGTRYRGAPELRSLMTNSLEAIRSIPGVVAVGATSTIPLGGPNNATIILGEGYSMKPGESAVVPLYIGATPHYFEAMGIRLLHGRTFNDDDTETSLPVIVIDRVERPSVN